MNKASVPSKAIQESNMFVICPYEKYLESLTNLPYNRLFSPSGAIMLFFNVYLRSFRN